MALEVKSIPHLAGTATSYATAIKAGSWIFLTGHEAYDLETGSTDAVSGPPGFPLFGKSRYRREGDLILERLNALLNEFGSDLSHGVRLDQYYPTPAAVEPYHHSRRANFGDYIPPSTSIVMERCFHPETAISTSPATNSFLSPGRWPPTPRMGSIRALMSPIMRAGAGAKSASRPIS
jgi:hypothetical protein